MDQGEGAHAPLGERAAFPIVTWPNAGRKQDSSRAQSAPVLFDPSASNARGYADNPLEGRDDPRDESPCRYAPLRTAARRWQPDLAPAVGPRSRPPALAHALRSKHGPETRCRFCREDGRSILTALRKRGLIKQRREDGFWTTPSPLPEAGYDPATAAIPF
jgi:hypothetical protein